MRTVLLVGELLACGFGLQSAKSTLLAWAEQAGHVEHLAGGEGHGMDHAPVDSDWRTDLFEHDKSGSLDPEADVPAERLLDQAGAGDTPETAS